MVKENLRIAELCREANGLSLVNLLEDADFRSALAELPDKSARGVAMAMVASHVESKMQILRELVNGGPLDIPHPLTDFVTDGVRVSLVGVKHGAFSGREIHPEYKQAVLRTVEEHPGIWFFEQGVAEQFGVFFFSDNTKEMSDAQIFFDAVQVEKTGNRWKNCWAIIKNTWKTMTASSSMLNFADKEIVLMFRRISSLMLKDPRYVYNAHAFISELKLSEPLDMEIRYILGNAALAPDISIDRSKIQAEWIRKNGLSQAKACGAITGADHTSQIRYFLENPDYDPKEAVRKIFQVLG